MRKIVCAAIQNIQYNSVVILGIRHFDKNMRSQIIPFALSAENKWWNQGFIDNKGNFLDRKEAYKIAKEAGQIIEKTGGKDSQELYSEDVY